MSTIIIAGLFETGPRAADAAGRLRQAGVDEDAIATFIVNAPGQHAQYPIGGDRDVSPGAGHADEGATKGAVVGGVAGAVAGAAASLAVGPIAIPLAAGVGAYTGSLVGALNGTDDKPKREDELLRTAGTMVAVNVSGGIVPAETVARILKDRGAKEVERAEGTWRDGMWADFDPLRAPQRVDVPPPISRSASSQGGP